MVLTWCATSIKNRFFMASCYHALPVTCLIELEPRERLDELGCPMHCSVNKTEIIGTVRETLFPEKFVESEIPRNMSWIVFVLSDDHLIVEEEQMLYDFNSFLGEVGGSLGLFLGVSLFSMYEGLTFNSRRLWKWSRKF